MVLRSLTLMISLTWICAFLHSDAQADPTAPSWWLDRSVIDTNAFPNDFAAINLGQVKWFASKAFEEFELQLPNGAGTNLQNFITTLSLSNNYSVVNQGQLKHVVMPFYDRLNTLGYTNGYPWSGTTTDDRNFAAANIGQAKQVFHFGLEKWLPHCTWVETSHYRINAGGTNFIDGSGHLWASDDFYTAGGIYSSPSSIANTTNDALYQTERYGDFGYVFPVSNGYNTVRLHFAEIYWTQTGQRVFDVFMEGNNVFDDADIWDIADKDVAYTKEFVVNVLDCQLNIDFVSVVDNAKVSAIEVAYHGDSFPGSLLSVDPTQYDFGTNFIGQAPGQVSLVVSNLGAATLDIDSLSFFGSGAGAFSVSPLPPIAFAGGADGVLTVSFTPTNVGLHTVDLHIESDSPTSPDLIMLSGMGSIPPPQFEAIPPSIGFPMTAVGTSAPPVTLVVSNIGNVSHTLMAVDVSDDALAEYTLTPLLSLPIVLQPGETASVNVKYTPARSGIRGANAALHFDANTQHHIVPLSGIGQGGGARTLYRVNSAGPTFTNGIEVWEEDSPYQNTGNPYTTVEAISNTVLDTLYQSQRWDPLYAPDMQYAFPVPAGFYSVQLHFAEIFANVGFVGARVFDVQIEGKTVLTNLDVYAETGLYTALIKDIAVAATDGVINVTFSHGVENPNVSGFEIVKDDVELILNQQVVTLGHLSLGQTSPTNTVVLTNLGGDPLEIKELGFIL